ncbi:hypothetical protein QLR68_00705 [Micromonospora sp. DH15]|nr:hypothetical protein [Micromonospora sp. Rc5]MDI5936759.1 hypothetical protein [Micromonospora sp. DH15]
MCHYEEAGLIVPLRTQRGLLPPPHRTRSRPATNADFTATTPRCTALTRRRSPPTCGRTT